jgi:hypothetical protein
VLWRTSGTTANLRLARRKIRDPRHVPTSSELSGDDDFHDLVLQQKDAGGDDEHESAADGGGSPGNEEKHGNFLRACQGGMDTIKIENRSWRCALAHVSSKSRHYDEGKESFNINSIAGRTAKTRFQAPRLGKMTDNTK